MSQIEAHSPAHGAAIPSCEFAWTHRQSRLRSAQDHSVDLKKILNFFLLKVEIKFLNPSEKTNLQKNF